MVSWLKKEEREISVVIEYFLLSLGCTVDLRLRYVPYLILVMVEGGRIGGVNLPELIGTLRKWGTCQLVAIGCWVSYRSFTNKWPRPAHCTVIRDGGARALLTHLGSGQDTSGAPGAGKGKPFKFLSLIGDGSHTMPRC